LLKRLRKCGWSSASDASFSALSIHLIALLAKRTISSDASNAVDGR
jgi:hypothetical protein